MVQETNGRRDEGSGEGKRPRPKLIAVKPFPTNGPTTLVEWEAGNDLFRAYVPTEAVVNGKVSVDDLEAGAEYGVRWERFLTVSLTPLDLAKLFRRRGIWTLEDLKQKSVQVKIAPLEAVAFNIAELIRSVEEEA